MQILENMIVMELIKSRLNQGLDPHLYFYRDQQKHEVDLIYKTASELIPIEIKASKTYNSHFLKGIDYFSSLFPNECKQGYIIYTGNQGQAIGWRQLINFTDAYKITGVNSS